MISADHLTAAARLLGLSGRPVLVHSSLRSFGEPVLDGANTLADALLALGCTVLVPTFTWERFACLQAPPGMRPGRNAYDYSRLPADGPAADGPAADGPPATGPAATGPTFTPDCGVIDADMGAVPAGLIKRPGAVRGWHPLCSFTAVGPLAEHLIAGQGPADVYAPIRQLAALGGSVLLIGVGYDRMTLLHAAEQQAGRRLFVRWARVPGDRIAMVEAGGCSTGFGNLAPVLNALSRATTVGSSRWTALPAARALTVAAGAIAAEPEITRCSADCLLCRDAVAGGPTDPVTLG